MRELLEKVLPVPEASRGVLVFSFHDCPCETGTLRQGTLPFLPGWLLLSKTKPD